MTPEHQEQVRDPEFWKRKSGLLPVLLRATEPDTYVLLNGSEGNFCLDTLGAHVEDGRSIAWSTAVGHYVRLMKGYLVVEAWGRRVGGPQMFPIRDVVDRPDEFHDLLQRDEPNQDQSIVVHALRVMSQMRALLTDARPDELLQHFLALTALALEGKGLAQFDPAYWQIDTIGPWKSRLSSNDWEVLLHELEAFLPHLDVQPKIDLMMRHASGAVFQEAHYVSLEPQNYTLPGMPPPPVPVLNDKYGDSAGVYFTPSPLARMVVEQALDALGSLPDNLFVFDPACGSGEFLRETIRQLELRRYTGRLRLLGWDILNGSLLMSRFGLAWEQRAPRSFGIEWSISAQDAIAASDWPSANVVLMNPPFASFQSLSLDAKARVKSFVDVPRPNLSAAFVSRAATSLPEGGVIASVVPSSITDGRDGKILREQLASHYRPTLVAKIGRQDVFARATVDAGVYVGRREVSPAHTPTRVMWADHQTLSIGRAMRALRRMSTGGHITEVADEAGFSVYPSADIGHSVGPWTPVPYRSVAIKSRYGSLPRLGDLFDIKQGVRLGSDVFLQRTSVIHRLPEGEQRFFRPAVVNATLRNGALSPSVYVWYPDGVAPVLKNEGDLAKAVPTFYEAVLRNAKSALMRRARVDPHRWWTLSEHRAWQVSLEPKLVTKYFGDYGSVAFDKDGEFVVVVGHAWLPKHATAKSNKNNPTVATAYVALAASNLFVQLLEAYCPHVGGGQFSMEKRFVARLPMVDLTSTAMPIDVLRQLASLGEAIGDGKAIDSDELESLVQGAFRASAGM